MDTEHMPAGVFQPFKENPHKRVLCSVSSSEQLSLTQESHYHDFYQIYYILRGSLTHHVNGLYTRVMRGDCFIVPPYMAHQIEIDCETSAFISISFLPEFLPPHALPQQDIQKLFSALTPTGLMPRLALMPQELLRMDELMGFALEEFRKTEPGFDCILQSALTSILILLARAYEREKQEFKYNSVMLSCLEYINTHFAQRLTTKDMASRMYLSEATFYRTFKRLTGHSFKEYLTIIRIRHACSLLRDKSVPISQVSTQCGYGNYSAFYRAFLQQMQISPIDYRQSYQ